MKKQVYIPLIVGISLVLDLVTKYFATANISPFYGVKILPFFNLVNVRNTGSAFGMFSSLGNVFFISVSLIAIGFIIYLMLRTDEDPVSLALILSGALGNLTDRIVYGYVRDFLDFHINNHHWPAFNVADSALTVGLVYMIFVSFRDVRKHSKKNPHIK